MNRDNLRLDADKKHSSLGGVFSDDARYGTEKGEMTASAQDLKLNGNHKHISQPSAKDAEPQNAQPLQPRMPQNKNSYGILKTQTGNAIATTAAKRNEPATGSASINAAALPIATASTSGNTTANMASSKFQASHESKLRQNDGGSSAFRQNRSLFRAERQMEKSANKLEKAKSNLPAKRKLKRMTYENAKTDELQNKLKFEKTPVPQSEHMKGPLPLRPVKAVGNAFVVNAHRKLYQAENDNVGVKAAHRFEMGAEAGARSAFRHNKLAPYSKVAKLEKKAERKAVNFAYKKTLAENPKLKSNPFKRAVQKQRIKRQYAKATREAQKTANKAKQAGSAMKKIGQAAAKHPIAAIIVILIVLLAMLLIVPISTCSSLGNGIMGTVYASTYLAADGDMHAAEDTYAAMEAELQDMLDNYETLYPGYDEYIYKLDDIEHDPYVLMSMLHALHEGEWAIDDVTGTLAMLFGRQYTLTETVTTEVRYRTVTKTYINPYTGLPYQVQEQEAYYYYIITVTLENFNLSHLPVYIMGESKLSRYALLMSTLGNRPDLFPVGSYPNASTYKEYEKYDVPQALLDADPRFAAMVAEANKYLGMPYVWGGYSPNTSFDCSGFVSWVMNQTGWDVGRLGARGLHSYSTPVPKSQARPGDLVFFHNTYAAEFPDQATHVGIYVGNGMMVHAGDPIGYTSIETKYWQDHLLGFGKIY